jgi:citrate lyase beta subunit
MNPADRPIRPRRSLLFVPALRPDRYAKALEAGADIVCVDMEDAVALERKDEGRRLAVPLFAQDATVQAERMARINALSTLHGLKDLQAILECSVPPPSIMVPKVRSAEEIQLLDALLSTASTRHIRFCVIIETNQALQRAQEIARATDRIDSLILGAVDLSADLRCEKSWEPLLYTRSRLVHAAASGGIDLLDVPFLNLDDPEGLRREASACARLGFTGKASIHPNQLPIIHEAFTPTPEQIAKARKVVAAFEQNKTGLVVLDGELIELPVVRSMYRVIAVAERVGVKP